MPFTFRGHGLYSRTVVIIEVVRTRLVNKSSSILCTAGPILPLMTLKKSNIKRGTFC